MQLKGDLRRALAAASGALLASSPAAAGDWTFDSALLLYKEADRVQAIEPVALARWDLGDDEALSAKVTLDVLTGASPNGAAPAAVPQTFTSPSGGTTYTIAPGDTPLDPTFLDTRGALSLTWEHPHGRFSRMTYSLNLSAEFDYKSATASATYAHDFNLKNTTLAAGVSLGSDMLNPVGGTPVPLTSLPTQPWVCEEDDQPSCPGIGPAPARLGDQTKSLSDVLVGVTQVLSPRSLLQLNYGWGTASGYLTDPYKNLSVVDGVPGSNQGNPVDHVYEARPDARTKQSLYAQYRHSNASSDSWDISFRHMWDDWGIVSETFDVHYRWRFGDHGYLQPHLRLYQQNAADFYAPFLVSGAPLPVAASADYRLGEMTATTLGIKYGHELASGRELGVHLEVYRQSGDSHPPEAIGVLQTLDLFPVITATMLQFNFSF